METVNMVILCFCMRTSNIGNVMLTPQERERATHEGDEITCCILTH